MAQNTQLEQKYRKTGNKIYQQPLCARQQLEEYGTEHIQNRMLQWKQQQWIFTSYSLKGMARKIKT